MNTEQLPWFAVAPPDVTVFRCARCENEIDIPPGADHHSGVCPRCGIETVYLNWSGRTVQILPTLAPPVVASLLRWAQEHLDELEYVELLVALEEIATVLQSVGVSS